MINISRQNFLCPEFVAKFQREVPLFLKVPEFLYSAELPRQKTSMIRSAVSTEHCLVTDTDRKTDNDKGPWLVPRKHSTVKMQKLATLKAHLEASKCQNYRWFQELSNKINKLIWSRNWAATRGTAWAHGISYSPFPSPLLRAVPRKTFGLIFQILR